MSALALVRLRSSTVALGRTMSGSLDKVVAKYPNLIKSVTGHSWKGVDWIPRIARGPALA